MLKTVVLAVAGLALSSAVAMAGMPMIYSEGGTGYPEVRQLPVPPPVHTDPAPYERWIQKFQNSPVKPDFSPPGVHYEKSFP